MLSIMMRTCKLYPCVEVGGVKDATMAHRDVMGLDLLCRNLPPKRSGGHRLTIKGVTQVDFVSQGIAKLDADKLAIPGPLHILLPIALRVGVRLEGKLSPDGVFTCRIGWSRKELLKEQLMNSTSEIFMSRLFIINES